MYKEIWCTLGPSSLNDRVISRLEEVGVSLFRLNLSHTKMADVAPILAYIQSQTSVPVCLDTEGAQIRTSHLAAGEISVQDNSTICIPRDPVAGNAQTFNLYPEYIVDQLVAGDMIKIDADVLAQVVSIKTDSVVILVLNGGKIGSNKAVTVVEREIDMPALTAKDHQALTIGKQIGIRHVALSFANYAEDVAAVRALSYKDTTVISKIECLNGLINLTDIVDQSDALLIDRGDLSRQVNIEQIPALQKSIVRYAKEAGVKIYVATNLMESMVTSPSPTRAEVNDVFNTLMDGADGLVLAAETAVGAYPVSTAIMVKKIIQEFENRNTFRWQRTHYTSPPLSSLIEPHGGHLVNRLAHAVYPQELDKCKVLKVQQTDLMDCVQIASGTYSPLTGFMNSEELESVLNTHRLPNNLPWTMPICLQVSEEAVHDMAVGDHIALSHANGTIHAMMEVSDIFAFDAEDMAQKWFGTTSCKHPGVARFMTGGNRMVAGAIMLIANLASAYAQYELTPAQTRLIFAQKGWSKVVGFHTRNVPHRAHEYIQLRALDMVHADGLYISPIIGPKKAGDFFEGPILRSYQLLLDAGIYPDGKVMLGAFATYPRYCGPREAVFTALCRKNMGCSHFIIGRDHTGVDGLYNDSQIRQLFERLHDVGIVPVFFDTIGYNPTTHTYSALATAMTSSISGKQMRSALLKNEPLPEWFMRDIVQDMLRAEVAAHMPVFYG